MRHFVKAVLGLTLITGIAVAQELTPGDAPLNEVAVPSDFYTFQITDNGGVAPGYNYIGMESRNNATGESISYLGIMDKIGVDLVLDAVERQLRTFPPVSDLAGPVSPTNSPLGRAD